MNQQFKDDVLEGLSKTLKTLPSKYFYDEIGDQLFVKIMNLPEYYLTRAEHEIFETKSKEIIQALDLNTAEAIDLIELGAGDGKKTKTFLTALQAEQLGFKYLPIDISEHALRNLETSIRKEFPKVKVETLQGDYFGVLENIKSYRSRKVIMFLGSNLGNLEDSDAQCFMHKLSAALQVGDKLILGLDRIKSEAIILPAYNDQQGITKAFNLNLLHRINKELNADFNIANFDHQPEYSEETGIAKSFLVSKVHQKVTFTAEDKSYWFTEGEKIQTEISRKYNDDILETLLTNTKLVQRAKISDSKGLFNSYILERKA